jgi:protein TonB
MKSIPVFVLLLALSCSKPTVNGPAPSNPASQAIQFEPIRIKALPTSGPEYPAKAKANRVHGTVTVYIHVSDKGEILKVYSEDGPPELRQAAEDYAKRFVFTPAKLNGKPATARYTLNVAFSLDR